uniref:GPI inositol-deacylase n=1 Tax=Strongyloides venezuelensis TaxID=75913 RepID=A0A0K0FI55_STRVS
MTSMWRNPKFYSLYEDKRLKYGFFLYGEGWYFHDLVESRYFDGIPIVFVPGNAADGAMVRSIGSILQNKTERLNSPFRFNVFSTHFNEEFSIFDVSVLKRQAKFLIDSLVELEKLYGNRRKKKYILMGHSMGGIVIKMALSESEWLRKNVAFILTMGTSLKGHPLKITRDFIEIYDKILSLNTVPVISMHGGFMDELIEESLTKDNNSLTFGYQGMDRVWSMADHKCLVWCNEAQRAISRLFFDYVTIPENAISTKKFNSLVQTIFNSSTFTYNNIEKDKLDEVFNYVEKQLINEGKYFFAIGKVDSSFPLIYKSKKEGRINLFPAKTYFYSRQMEYVFSLEVIEKEEDYYVNKDAKIKIIKNNDVEKLNPSILKEKIKFTDVTGNVKVFTIPFITPEFIYKITLKSTNNEMSKLLFKAENQQSISMNNKLMFNFFDGNTKTDGTLFVISNPKTFFSNSSHTEYELDYKIDIGLTILRAIKLNISNIPFLLSFMGVLFSYNVNNLYKLLSLQIIFYVVTYICNPLVLQILIFCFMSCKRHIDNLCNAKKIILNESWCFENTIYKYIHPIFVRFIN